MKKIRRRERHLSQHNGAMDLLTSPKRPKKLGKVNK